MFYYSMTIYQLINPVNMAPFYVGRTDGRLNVRLSAHISEATTNKKTSKDIFIMDLLNKNKSPLIERLQHICIESDSPNFYSYVKGIKENYTRLEKEWIKEVGKNFTLTNQLYNTKK